MDQRREAGERGRGLSRRAVVMAAMTVPLAALIALLAWGMARSGGSPGGLLVNNKLGETAVEAALASDFTLETLSGTEYTLASSQGKLVMIDFWSSWCPPCVSEAPALEQVYREYRDRGVEFVGVAIWDRRGDVQAHVDRFGVSYVNAMDDRGVVAIDYGVRGIPEKHFISDEGLLVYKVVGPMKEGDLRRVLDKLLAD